MSIDLYLCLKDLIVFTLVTFYIDNNNSEKTAMFLIWQSRTAADEASPSRFESEEIRHPREPHH